MTERFERDERYRQKTIEAGTSGEDIALIVQDLKRWAEDVDGWYGLAQAENLYRQ